MPRSNALMLSDAHPGSPWEHAAAYEKQERSVRQVSKLVLAGAIDVVFFRASDPRLVVASEDRSALDSIRTRIEGDALLIEREGVTVGGGTYVSGSGNVVMGGVTIHVGGRRGGVTIEGDLVGSAMGAQGRCIIGLALPEAPGILIRGSGDVTLYGLDQPRLDVVIQGSGDVTALGRVDRLDVEVAGSGDVDTRELMATTARLLIAGSGDIDALVTHSVDARIAGSGDIVVRGNPPVRTQSVAGSGNIRFKA